jgi:glycosyltransferase involved in cell wall biosynthesis
MVDALPRISVIIPHYCQPEALAECLTSLDAQSLPRDRFEVLVVDNDSPGGIAAIEAVVGDRARLFVETTKGAGPARNRGAAEARGQVFAFIDADCIASPRWLEEGLAGLDRFDVVGGRVDVSVGDERAMTGPEAFERVFAFDFRSYIEDKGFTGSGNLLCRREVFDAVGGFRQAVSEDKDWSQRATAMGFSLGYHDAAAIAHPARTDWRELTRKWSRLNRESLLLSEDGTMGRARWAVRNWLVPLSILPHAVKMLRSPKLPDMATRLRGLRTLAAIRMWRFADGHRALFERGKN